MVGGGCVSIAVAVAVVVGVVVVARVVAVAVVLVVVGGGRGKSGLEVGGGNAEFGFGLFKVILLAVNPAGKLAFKFRAAANTEEFLLANGTGLGATDSGVVVVPPGL